VLTYCRGLAFKNWGKPRQKLRMAVTHEANRARYRQIRSNCYVRLKESSSQSTKCVEATDGVSWLFMRHGAGYVGTCGYCSARFTVGNAAALNVRTDTTKMALVQLSRLSRPETLQTQLDLYWLKFWNMFKAELTALECRKGAPFQSSTQSHSPWTYPSCWPNLTGVVLTLTYLPSWPRAFAS